LGLTASVIKKHPFKRVPFIF